MWGFLSQRIKATFILPTVVLTAIPVFLGSVIALELGVATVLAVCLLWAIGRWWVKEKLPQVERGTVAFFHPFGENKGGGERVLWCAVKALQEAHPNAKIAVYSGPDVTPGELREGAEQCFNIRGLAEVEVIPLRSRRLLDPGRYPRFTLIRQAVGSTCLAWEGLRQTVPEVFVDTCGWAFCYPLVWLAGARLVSYVHYPTISMDMLTRVWEGHPMYNNDASIASSGTFTLIKLMYYHVFATAYGMVGALPSTVMANSSWTIKHLSSLWWRFDPPSLVYPPVDTVELQLLPLDRPLKQLYLISVSQFRPEKNHELQLQAYKLAISLAEQASESTFEALKSSKLKFVGSCRNSDDKERLNNLKELAVALGLEQNVEIFENIPFRDLKIMLGAAVGGLHTMVDEHFGISVVEYMAAGVIPISHNSGGPKEDILRGQGADGDGIKMGYLAETVEEYALAILEVLSMDQRDRLKISAGARARSAMFSQDRFMRGFLSNIDHVMPSD